MFETMHTVPLSATFASGTAVLHIRVLGEFAIDFGGRPVAPAAWQRSHARRLIQLLCSAPRFMVSRAQVISALWPGFEDERARNRLHHTIHCVRKAWEEIPLAARPQINVTSERVELVPAAGTLIDANVFEQGVEADCAEAEERLACLEVALESYRGALAQGWDDCDDIAARRARLAQLRESALAEAVDTAVELGRVAVALRHAHQLALLLETDCDAHCRYAELLAENGRADAALLHCQHVRGLLEQDDPACAEQLARTVQTIQRTANREAASAAAGAGAGAGAGLGTDKGKATQTTPSSLVSRQCVPAPSRQVLGYDALMQKCASCIDDPFSSVISLVGPPGAGKSLLAASVAHRMQATLQHGALWIACADVATPQALVAALASGLQPLCGELASDEASLRRLLQNKEMLIVLDGLQRSAALVRQCMTLALAGRDTRWLVTAWAALRVMGERVLHVEPSALALPQADGSVSHAAQIIHAQSLSAWPHDDTRTMRLFEKIGAALDGLPMSLEIAALCLRSMSPNELWARLQRDPSTLMRSSQDDAHSPAARLADSVASWLEAASPNVRRMLSLLSRCKSWLTRDDIAVLLGETDVDAVDTLIEHCLRNHFLLRRTSTTDYLACSEFRVPRVVSAALQLMRDMADPAWCMQRLEAWLKCGHLSDEADAEGRAAAASRWFDNHIDDLDSAAIGWLEGGRLHELAALCSLQSAHWSVALHAPRVLVWLDGLGESMDAVDAAQAAPLLMERARVHLHQGEMNLACDDASRALARMVGMPDPHLRQQAVDLIQRYGAAQPQGRANTGVGRGVEAGESLLRVAQLAVRHGQLGQALSVCAQSVEVFSFFGLAHGLVKAHHYRAKISFAQGDTERALACLTDMQQAARGDDGREAARAELMQANVMLSAMRFSQAIESASSLVSKAEQAGDNAGVARAMSVVAWAYYGQGALPLARALCNDLRHKAAQAGGAALRLNVELLSALIDARCGRPAAALANVGVALELLVSNQPLLDVQSNLVNAAELALHLDRQDLALPLVRSLQEFAKQPEHRLRDWVAERVRAIMRALPHGEAAATKSEPAPGFAEALRRLAQAPG